MSLKNVLMILLFFSVPVLAEEEKPWSDALDLSLVGTGGNSETLTFGFKNEYTYNWEKAKFVVSFGGVGVKSTRVTRYAEGTADDYVIVEEKETIKTEENFFLSSKYEKTISGKLFMDLDFDWERNEFAGVKNRYSAGVGVGHKWIENKRRVFSASCGVHFNQEELVYEPVGFDKNYGSLRLSYEWKELWENATFKQNFQAKTNFDESQDYRIDLKNELEARLNSHMLLKIGANFNFDNQPAFKTVPLVVDDLTTLQLPYELKKLDYIFTTSLVLKF